MTPRDRPPPRQLKLDEPPPIVADAIEALDELEGGRWGTVQQALRQYFRDYCLGREARARANEKPRRRKRNL